MPHNKKEDDEILKNGLIGLYVHARNLFSDGSVKEDYLQGRIIGIVADCAIIQTFSWLTGDCYTILSYPLSILLEPLNAYFYHNAKDMNDFYERKLQYMINDA